MIGLDVGLWSGFKRKMEIAESFAQPIVVVRITSYYLLELSFPSVTTTLDYLGILLFVNLWKLDATPSWCLRYPCKQFNFDTGLW
jgi:hypothetical protein